jgi:hypothetical protein
MDAKQIVKQMLAFNKTVFDTNFNSMKALQEQTEIIINKFWEKTPMFPEEGRKAISEWLKAYKKGCEDYKNIVDENFQKVEDSLTKGK